MKNEKEMKNKPNVALTERQFFSALKMLNFAKSYAELATNDWDDESAQAIVYQVEQGLNHRETVFD